MIELPIKNISMIYFLINIGMYMSLNRAKIPFELFFCEKITGFFSIWVIYWIVGVA